MTEAAADSKRSLAPVPTEDLHHPAGRERNSRRELLRVDGIRVEFQLPHHTIVVLDGIDLRVEEGEILGLVGESGSGKSVTALTIAGLLRPPGVVTGARCGLPEAISLNSTRGTCARYAATGSR